MLPPLHAGPHHRSTTDNNVSAPELAHFATLADHWWDPQGEMRALHAINPLRVDYILQHTDLVFNKQILDIGCGGGLLAEALAQAGAKVTALDMSAELLQVARQHACDSGLIIHYLQQTAEAHAITAGAHYDIVTCMELLEHVPDPAALVGACGQLVKPQGYVFFSTINRNFKAWLFAIVAAEYLLKLVPKGTHQVQKFIRPSELCRWLEPTPLRACHMSGIRYHPLWKRFMLGSSSDVNYLLAAKHQG